MPKPPIDDDKTTPFIRDAAGSGSVPAAESPGSLASTIDG